MSEIRFSRVPWPVLTDPKLSASAVRLYGVLAAHVWQGKTVRLGYRKMAELAAMSKSTVQLAIVELIERKHVTASGMGSGRRNLYTLTSELFGQKQGDADVVVSHPRTGRKRLVSVRSA